VVAIIISKGGLPSSSPRGLVALLLSKGGGCHYYCSFPLERKTERWPYSSLYREREREREREVALPLPLEREMAQSPFIEIEREVWRERIN
jgi:hypothetical protein